ncbi:MAG: hypothetical protein ABIH03_00275, partial [Pseudomonadota bacterium]
AASRPSMPGNSMSIRAEEKFAIDIDVARFLTVRKFTGKGKAHHSCFLGWRRRTDIGLFANRPWYNKLVDKQRSQTALSS